MITWGEKKISTHYYSYCRHSRLNSTVNNFIIGTTVIKTHTVTIRRASHQSPGKVFAILSWWLLLSPVYPKFILFGKNEDPKTDSQKMSSKFVYVGNKWAENSFDSRKKWVFLLMMRRADLTSSYFALAMPKGWGCNKNTHSSSIFITTSPFRSFLLQRHPFEHFYYNVTLSA